MIQIDRMTLADISNPLAAAKEVIRQLGNVQPPIDIEGIAYGAGITEIQELQTQGFEGALMTPDHKQDGIILVNKNSQPERLRFTIGHEVGHLLILWHKPPPGGFQCTKADMLARADGGSACTRMEAEANAFSAEVLMPENLFKQDLLKLKSPGLEHIVDLAERRYETSKLATTRRFVDLYDEPSALVLTKEGVVQQFHRHKFFPFIDLTGGQTVHRKSLTATFGGGGGCSNAENTNSAFWTNAALKRGEEMYEQVLIQGGGYRLTLLTMDQAACEDEDDEYERDRSEWNPRFR